MKRILMMLCLMVSFFTFGEEKDVVLSQRDLLTKLNFEKATKYEKYKEVLARRAEDGEVVKTYTADGLETENSAKAGDYVVKNQTGAKEMYILTEKKFEARYIFKEKVDEKWNLYVPVGKIKGIKVTTKVMETLGVDKNATEFYIMANWGEKMVVKKGDFLVAPYDNSEVYRIAEKEFFETYRKIEAKGKINFTGGLFFGF